MALVKDAPKDPAQAAASAGAAAPRSTAASSDVAAASTTSSNIPTDPDPTPSAMAVSIEGDSDTPTAAQQSPQQLSADFLLSKELDNGGLSSNEYLTLLFEYLIAGDLMSARLLWRRIPRANKEATDVTATELQAVWAICARMLAADYRLVYPAINDRQWSAGVKPLADALLRRVRARMLSLVPAAYTSLPLTQLAHLVGLSDADTRAQCAQRGWTVSAQGVVRPTTGTAVGGIESHVTSVGIGSPSRGPAGSGGAVGTASEARKSAGGGVPQTPVSSQQRLSSLVGLVSFIEN